MTLYFIFERMPYVLILSILDPVHIYLKISELWHISSSLFAIENNSKYTYK